MRTSSEITFVTECMTKRIEDKLDLLVDMVGKLSGWKGLGDNLIANIVGNILTK